MGALASFNRSQAYNMKSKHLKEQNLFTEIDRSQSTFNTSLQIQRVAQHYGFDWDDAKGVITKLYEELAEIIEADASTLKRDEHIREELGDLLFTTISLARHYAVDPEVALNEANRKFEYRFQKMIAILEANSLNLNSASKEQLEAAWQQAKQQEK